MPNNLNNWTYKDVEKFLKAHGFVECPNFSTGHRLFKKIVDGVTKYKVEVQFHGNKTRIPIKTLKFHIITKSGISEEEWKAL